MSSNWDSILRKPLVLNGVEKPKLQRVLSNKPSITVDEITARWNSVI